MIFVFFSPSKQHIVCQYSVPLHARHKVASMYVHGDNSLPPHRMAGGSKEMVQSQYEYDHANLWTVAWHTEERPFIGAETSTKPFTMVMTLALKQCKIIVIDMVDVSNYVVFMSHIHPDVSTSTQHQGLDSHGAYSPQIRKLWVDLPTTRLHTHCPSIIPKFQILVMDHGIPCWLPG